MAKSARAAHIPIQRSVLVCPKTGNCPLASRPVPFGFAQRALYCPHSATWAFLTRRLSALESVAAALHGLAGPLDPLIAGQ
jgi:hypothetical protein